MGLELQKDMLPILAVVLITWGGVLGYMFRLDRTTKELERRVDDLESTERREDVTH
jgi:CcmD family protein